MPRRDKLLILCRREDMKNYACKWAEELGFEAHGATNNEDGKALLDKHKFVYCALGCVFVNDKYWEKELNEMKAAMDEKDLRYAKMPTFGNVRDVLKEAGLWEEKPKEKPKVLQMQGCATAANPGLDQPTPEIAG